MVLEALGAVGSFLGGGAQLGNMIAQLIELGHSQPKHSRGFQQFQRAAPSIAQFASRTFYNPVFQGRYPAGAEPGLYPGMDPADLAYAFRPSEATRNVYSSYLNRQYGLPDNVVRAMTSQALQPIRPQAPPPGLTPAAARQATQISPQQVSQSLLASRTPEAIRQQSYLQDAARLASYNLYRMQQFPQIL